ncbi:DNA Topoisomerase I (eukaryota) [Rhizoctonia solani]|uniref:DNA topoisomerase 1 n=1 Tax=Rhizoctonia solani TaxID=456999 RepID=A0A8H7IHS5_9AGAM|nr:DNA Topoisomerase I (eukaryota) [Rhizoctonia solani]
MARRVTSDSESGDDAPLAQSSTATSRATSKRPRPSASADGGPAKRPRSTVNSDDSGPDVARPAKQLAAAAVPLPGALKKLLPLVKTEDGDVDMADADESDDEPLNKRIKAAANGKSKSKPVSSRMKTKAPVKKESSDDSDDDDDDDDNSVTRNKNGANESGEEEVSASESESEPDVPLSKKKPAARKKVKQESDEDEDVKPARKTPKKNGKAVKKEESDDDVKPSKKQKEEEEEAERFKWYVVVLLLSSHPHPSPGGRLKLWVTVPPNGQPSSMLAYSSLLLRTSTQARQDEIQWFVSEELAGWFGALLETEHAADEVFQKNFFGDWQAVLKDHPPRNGIVIKDFDKCDFRPMFDFFEAEKAKEIHDCCRKKAIKEAKSKDEEKYTACTMDGRPEKVGNFRIEPPGLFRGRGKHPKKGKHKYRLRPEDITINIGQNAPIPVPNIPGKWGKIQHDQTVTWLASWKENVNGNFKYVFLAAGSSLKGQSDMQKFEKARELKKHVDRIREDYTRDLKNKTSADRQRATAMYFIDRLALRADSIRYYNVVEVEPQIFKNIRIFKGDGKSEGDALFDRVSTGGLNKHLNSYMKGLSAKVFRTYNASITFQKQLDENTPADADITQKLAAYNRANRMVAILCNHQKSVSKNHDASMGKLGDQLRGLKYNRMKLRHQLFTLDKKLKKKHPELDELESDLDDEFIERWEDAKREEDIAKARKKFEKDNEKRVEKYDRLKEERGTEQAAGPKGRTPEKVLDAITKLDEKIKMFKFKMQDKEEGKEVALGTSKINYLDPRITAAWCKKHDVPIEKIFAKTLLNKFPWAMEIDEDWKF